MTEQTNEEVAAEEIGEAAEERSYWQLSGAPQREEIVYYDEKGSPRFPDTASYVNPSEVQLERIRKGQKVYADDSSAAEEEAPGGAPGDGEGGRPTSGKPFEDMESGRAFWQLAENGEVAYVDEEDRAFFPGDEGYVDPPQEELEVLFEGERVYAGEGEG